MTPAQLITRVRYRIGEGDNDQLDTPILYALNTIQRDAINQINFQELMVHDTTSLQLAEDTTNYDLPTDFVKMIIAWNNDQYQQELQRIVPREYKNYLSDVDTTTGTYPQYYDLLDSAANIKQIYLFPLKASLTTGTIASVADYSGTVAGTVLATDTSHGLSTGNTITIVTTGGTDYSGTYEVTYVSANTFYFTATWVATGSGTWTKLDYVPFVYQKRLDDLTATGNANILTTYYQDLYIEGAAYIMYRDEIYRDKPEQIAFRQQQYQKQIDLIRKAQRQPDKISKVLPKRILPSIRRLYTTQFSGYADA